MSLPVLPPPVSCPSQFAVKIKQGQESTETKVAAEEESIKGPKREEMHEPQVEKARMPSLVPKIFILAMVSTLC